MLPTRELLKHFSFHPSRIKTFKDIIQGLITGCSVQIPSLSKAIAGKANLCSKQKNIYRFLKEEDICEESTAKLIESILPPAPWVLAIDRTNWKYGKHDYNILTLAVAQDGIAVPILFTPLESCGNSGTSERIELVEKFIKIFGIHKIEALVADREFVGEEWFAWLDKEKVPFAIRIKSNMKLKHTNGGTMQAGNMCKSDKTYKTSIAGQKLKVSCKELEGEKLIVAHSESILDAINLYAKRWDIETTFKALKTNGFRLESSRVKCRVRFKKLLLIASIAFAIAVKAGKIEHQRKAIPFKKTIGYRLFSWFTYGLNTINQAISKGGKTVKKILKIILKPHPELKTVQ